MFLGLLVGLVAISAFSSSLYAQQKSNFKVTGPCMACGADRIVGIVKAIDGVNSATFDAGTSTLSVDFSSVSASLTDIQLELSINGYDAGGFSHDVKYKLPACALAGGVGMRGDQAADVDEPGIDDIEGLEADTDWENPDALGMASSADDDIDLLGDDEEIDNADELNAFGDDTNTGDEFGSDEDEDDDL